MDSSFLTYLGAGVGIYAGFLFLKMVVQFGLPNHPAKFTAYLVTFCAVSFLAMRSLVDFNFVGPWFWLKWRTLPLVSGGVALLMQAIMTIGNFSLIQQKVVSRIPLMAGLLCLAFFQSYADYFFTLTLFVSGVYLMTAVRNARLQKRLFFKMLFFLGFFGVFYYFNTYWLYVLREGFLFLALFYFFQFEQTFGVSALKDEMHGLGEAK